MTTITGEIKVIIDYGEGVNPNWFIVINDAEGQEHKVYSGDHLAEFTKDDIVQVEGTTITGKKGAYIKATKFMRINEPTNQDATQPVAQPPATIQNNVQDYTRVPVNGSQKEVQHKSVTREEGMLIIGCWTRGITAKSKEEVKAYINYALNDYRERNSEDDNVPF